MWRTRSRLIALLCMFSHGLKKPLYLHIKQQQIEAMLCAYNGKALSFWLPTGLGQVALSRGLTIHHGPQTWDRLQHGSNYIATSFANDWPSKHCLQWCALQHAWHIHWTSRFSSTFWDILVFCTHPRWISPIYFLFLFSATIHNFTYHYIQFHISRYTISHIMIYITYRDIQCVHLSNNNVSVLKQ